MKILKGKAAASGITQGTVCLYSTESEDIVPHYTILSAQVPNELARLREAVEIAQRELEPVIESADKLFDKQTAAIFKAHLHILRDEGLRQKIERLIRSRRINAEHAVSDTFEGLIREYEVKEEHFRELVHDFYDARNRILKAFNLETGKFRCPRGEQEPVIVAARRLIPSMVTGINKDHVLAFVTEEGSLTSHAMILARAFGVPMIFGISVEEELTCGVQVIVDGSAGKVIVEPDGETRAYYDKKLLRKEKRRLQCLNRRGLPVTTAAGQRIRLKLNVSTPEERPLIRELRHDGIGLLRTEFLFIGREVPPAEDEQTEMYGKFLELDPKLGVRARLLDISSDKLPSYLKLAPEMNLDLGMRGAITVEAFPEIYLTQVKALLRANRSGNLELLYPMVSDLEDLKTYRDLVGRAKRALQKEGVKFNPRFKEGVMVETPGAVVLIDEILREVDFINIGSNDLLQYTLAASRGNRRVEERYHIMHPSLLKFIEMIASAGARFRKEVCLCGEISSFEEHYPLLLQTGLKSFSVAVSKFPDIQCELSCFDGSAHKHLRDRFYRLKSKPEIDKFFHRFI